MATNRSLARRGPGPAVRGARRAAARARTRCSARWPSVPLPGLAPDARRGRAAPGRAVRRGAHRGPDQRSSRCRAAVGRRRARAGAGPHLGAALQPDRGVRAPGRVARAAAPGTDVAAGPAGAPAQGLSARVRRLSPTRRAGSARRRRRRPRRRAGTARRSPIVVTPGEVEQRPAGAEDARPARSRRPRRRGRPRRNAAAIVGPPSTSTRPDAARARARRAAPWRSRRPRSSTGHAGDRHPGRQGGLRRVGADDDQRRRRVVDDTGRWPDDGRAGVEHDPQRRRPGHAVAQAEVRVVGPCRAAADQHRVVRRAQAVGVRPAPPATRSSATSRRAPRPGRRASRRTPRSPAAGRSRASPAIGGLSRGRRA